MLFEIATRVEIVIILGKTAILSPKGYFQIKRSGGGLGLDPTSSLEAKFGSFCHHKTQKLGKRPNFGVIYENQRAKFGVFCHLYS